MSLEWETKSFSDLVEIIGGGTPKTSKEEYWDGNIPWISIKDFNNDLKYIKATEKTITELGLENSSTKILEPGDLIISARGTVGEIAMISSPMAFNQSCYGLRAYDFMDKGFTYYLLKYNIDKLKNSTHGSVFDTITTNTFNNIFVNVPSIDIQKKINDILSNIDKKIELNMELNNNLFKQLISLYKDWMFNFTPFKDKSFKSSSFGLIPEDWNVGTLGDIIEIFDSKRVPLSGNDRENMEKIYPYYGAASLMDYVDDYIFDGTYLLIGEDGTVTDDKGFPILQYVWGKFWVNNHAHIVKGKKGFNVESLYLLLSQTNIQSIVTGAVQPKVNQNNLKSLEVIIPSKNVMKEFNELIKPFFEAIKTNEMEIENLTKLRDVLLPKLMSGEIDVSEVNCD